jgi:ferredoxin
MKASINSTACVGHGLCYTTAPEVYEDDEDGFGRVRHNGQVPPGKEDAARTGAGNCPERAVTVT